MKILILIFCTLFFLGCANTKTNTSKENSDTIKKQGNPMTYKELAAQKLSFTNKKEEKMEYIENENNTFVLCKKTVDGTVAQPRNAIRYVVYNIKTKEMVYEGSIDGGFVNWYDTNRLAIYQQVGIPMQGMSRDDMIKIYDVIEKTIQSKSSVEK